MERTEAQHRGLDLLQILQALREMGNPTETGSEDSPLFTYEVRELQQYHRTLISHLYVLLPILSLTHWQTPYRTEIGRVGGGLLVSLLCLRCSDEWGMPAWIHAQYFGNLWTFPVPGRSTSASLHAEDWADTLSIWIYPSGVLSTRFGHRGEQEGAEPTLTDLPRQSLRHDDEESQRRGLLLLHLLKTKPQAGQPPDDVWEGFIQVLAFSSDLLTSLTYAVSHPLAEDLHDLSLQGVECVYGVFLNYLEPAPPVLSVTMTLISEGLLAAVLDRTLLNCQEEGSHTNTNAANILLALSLKSALNRRQVADRTKPGRPHTPPRTNKALPGYSCRLAPCGTFQIPLAMAHRSESQYYLPSPFQSWSRLPYQTSHALNPTPKRTSHHDSRPPMPRL